MDWFCLLSICCVNEQAIYSFRMQSRLVDLTIARRKLFSLELIEIFQLSFFSFCVISLLYYDVFFCFLKKENKTREIISNEKGFGKLAQSGQNTGS
jgi:hypothetical protein